MMKPAPNTDTQHSLTELEAAAMRRAAAGIRQQAAHGLAQGPLATAVFQQTMWLHQTTDAEIAGAQADGLQVACQTGCHHCCAAKVEALAPEVFLIVDQVQQQTADERAALMDRLQAHATTDSLRGARPAAPWSQRPLCPLLVGGLCSVYAVRPAVCRKAHSLDARACETGAPQIPQSLRVLVTAQARSQGTAQALGDVGLGSSSHELVSALLLALTDTTARARWLAGEAVFAQPVPLAPGASKV
jgi:uncharacterized protein